MIVTVTCNPALDKTVRVDRLRPGQLNRVDEPQRDAGGKGVNVAKTVAALGGRATATGFVAGSVGAGIVRQVAADPAITADFVTAPGETRTNLKVIDEAHGLTELNEPGPVVGADDAARLEAKVAALAPGAIVVLAGSLARGLPVDFYARLVRVVHAAGGQAYVDADGPALAAALAAGPDLIKPNRVELAQLTGADPAQPLAGLAGLARRTVSGGVGHVVVSLGAEGALFVTADAVWRAAPVAVPVRSTVGAGDAMVAALALAAEQGLGWRAAAALAMAASAGAVTTAGTQPPDRALTDRLLPDVRLEDLLATAPNEGDRA